MKTVIMIPSGYEIEVNIPKPRNSRPFLFLFVGALALAATILAMLAQ